MKNRFIASLAVLTFVMAGVLTLRAQTTDEGPGPSEQPSAPMEVGQQPNPDNPQNQPDANAPSPDANAPVDESAAQTDQGVARISMIHGDVSTQRGDSGDWSAAILNAPVMGGDKVSTGDNARVELQLDFANILRLGPSSQANISNLTKSNIQIQLSQGMASYTVFKNGDAEPEIDTPNVSIHPSHNDGVFRVEVQPDGDTVVTVRKGEAQISTPQGSTEVRAGEMATVRGSANDAQYKISDAAARDDFDRWSTDRDRIIENAQSSRHTNRYYVGSQDLDTYGRWQNVPDYGDVWVPDEPEDWAPYRDGNWVYEPYYGWTWVGYEPWGWAPYHYGRWMYLNSGWGWWPGPVYGGGFYRPLWAPAYVSFFGWGGGFGFGVGFGGWGGFGWLPIGPCDAFHPWWGGWGGRFGSVGFHGGGFGRFGGIRPLHNGMRYSNVNNLHNTHIGRALSTVGAGQFGTHSGRAVPASGAQLNGARMMTGNLPVVPTKASLSASGRAAAPSTIRNGGSQHFFGNSRNMAHPASFQQQTAHLQQAMQQNHVTPVQAGGRESASAGARGPMATGSMQKPSAGTPAVGRENNPGARNTGNQAAASQNANRGGNRPFTAPSSRNDRPSGATSAQPQRSMNSRAQNGNPAGYRPFTAPNNRNDRPSGATSAQPQHSMNTPQNGNPGGFRPFTPPSNSRSATQSSRNNGSYWNRTAPSSRGSTYAGNSGRPQLDMRQPVVRPRSSYGNGGYRGSPSYPANRGTYGGRPSAPSYGGRAPSYGGRAPSYGGHSSGPSGGGHPSGGGGHSSGGGGGHSSGGGGGHSSGGGGGHSGGGHR